MSRARRSSSEGSPSSSSVATGAVHLGDLAEGEQVLDARPVGDETVGWALTSRRILRTVDDGDSWAEVAGPWQATPGLAAFTTSEHALLVEATSSGGIVVHRTADAGRTFASATLTTFSGTVPRWLDASDQHHATLIVGPPDADRRTLDVLIPPRVLTTADGGASWTDERVAEAVDRAWITADGTGYANVTGPARGLYRLAGHDLPVQRLSPPGDDETGPGGGPTYRVVAQRGRHVVVESLLATGMQVAYRLLVSDDAGSTWRKVDGPATSYVGTGVVTSTADLGEKRLVTAAQSVDIGIVTQRTDDDGLTWRTLPTGSCASRIQLRTAAPRRIWVVGDLSACEGGARDGATRITRSADGGATWSRTDPSTRRTKPR